MKSLSKFIGFTLLIPNESMSKIGKFFYESRMIVLESWMKLKEANMSGPLRAESAIVLADAPKIAFEVA